MKLNDVQRIVLSNFLADGGALREAIDKFLSERQQRMEADCADAMRSVPRSLEIAADYAAKAEAYKTFFSDLQRFADDN